MADGGDRILVILEIDCILIMAISLGRSVDVRNLRAPGDRCVIHPLFRDYY